MLNLLELPCEIRHHIWLITFGHLSITPETLSNFSPDTCKPCKNNKNLPERWTDVIRPLLTCKQIYREAEEIFYSTLTLVLTSYSMIDRILTVKPKFLNHYRQLTLYIHLNDDNRIEWAVACLNLTVDSPCLVHIFMHNHMRPPMSYEHLVDGLFFAVPLVTMPRHINQTLKFDYIFEDVMFASPWLGEIKCSDALDEHELVIRDLMVDPGFVAAAVVRDLESMTGILLRIARSHEQPWFAKLQRRRLAQLARQENVTESGGSQQ